MLKYLTRVSKRYLKKIHEDYTDYSIVSRLIIPGVHVDKDSNKIKYKLTQTELQARINKIEGYVCGLFDSMTSKTNHNLTLDKTFVFFGNFLEDKNYLPDDYAPEFVLCRLYYYTYGTMKNLSGQ
jgi:hypothetical protein